MKNYLLKTAEKYLMMSPLNQFPHQARYPTLQGQNQWATELVDVAGEDFRSGEAERWVVRVMSGREEPRWVVRMTVETVLLQELGKI